MREKTKVAELNAEGRDDRRMKPLEFYAWHAALYAAKTTHLTREADYAYRRILDHIFIHDQEHCRVIDDDATLIGIARCTIDEWKSIKRALISGPSPLLRKKGRWIYSPRLIEEIAKAKDKSASQRKKAIASWESRRDATPEPLQSRGIESASPSPSMSNSPVSVREPENEKPARAQVLPPDATAAERLVHKFGVIALNPPPPDQLIVAWLATFGEPLILETLADVEHDCRGKHFKYLEAILHRRKENPDERPQNRRNRNRPDRRDTQRLPVVARTLPGERDARAEAAAIAAEKAAIAQRVTGPVQAVPKTSPV